MIVLWGVSASLCVPVYGQTPSDKTALNKANELADKAFVQRCKGKPDSAYVGPVSAASKLLCTDVVRVAPHVCQVVIEYKIEHKDTGALFKVTWENLTPADEMNNVTGKWLVIADFKVLRVRHIADGTWGPWQEDWQNRDVSQGATYEVMKLRHKKDDWVTEPGDDVIRFLQGWDIDSSQNLACADILDPTMHRPPNVLDSIHCHDSLNHRVPVQKVLREDALRWCGITPQQWDDLRNSDWKNLQAAKQTRPQLPGAPGRSLASNDGVTWINGTLRSRMAIPRLRSRVRSSSSSKAAQAPVFTYRLKAWALSSSRRPTPEALRLTTRRRTTTRTIILVTAMRPAIIRTAHRPA